MQTHHYSVGRSGCTLVSQLLAGVFGKKNLEAGHKPYFLEGDQPLVITVRDFRDVVMSFWRVGNDISERDIKGGRKATEQEMMEQLLMVKASISDCLNPTRNMNQRVLVVRYEDFFPNDFDSIFDQFEAFFEVSINKKVRRKLKLNYSFTSNKRKASKLKSFQEYDKDYLHGGHCYKGKVGGWKDLLPVELHGALDSLLASELYQWGYQVTPNYIAKPPSVGQAGPFWGGALDVA